MKRCRYRYGMEDIARVAKVTVRRVRYDSHMRKLAPGDLEDVLRYVGEMRMLERKQEKA